MLDLFDAVEASRNETGSVLKMDADTLALSVEAGCDDPRIPCLIESFLGVACYYDNLPSSRSWFRAPSAYRASMDAFVAHGFAYELEDLTRWSERIAPHMTAAGLWTDDQAPNGASPPEQVMHQARRAWDEMPIFVRRRFFARPEMDVIAFISVLGHCWDGTNWQPFTKERRFLDFPDARRLADRIIEVAAQTRMSL